MNGKLCVLKLIALGFHHLIVNEEFSYDDVEKILNDLPKHEEKIELSASEIKTMLTYVAKLDIVGVSEGV